MIEVPLRSDPINYEFDKSAGATAGVDRFLSTTMFSRRNYRVAPYEHALVASPTTLKNARASSGVSAAIDMAWMSVRIRSPSAANTMR